ncbi:MAG TPA: hypothetical protein PLW99_00730 [Candidatus Paceibacterota bacterium]|nr:hypothetical protein [Candidatus Paceibacterota bacterium]
MSNPRPRFIQQTDPTFPIIWAIVLALLSAVPIFHSGHWITGILCVMAMYVLLRVISYGVTRISSSNPARHTLLDGVGYYGGTFVALLVFFVSVYLTK